jgi:hypothetical protein
MQELGRIMIRRYDRQEAGWLFGSNPPCGLLWPRTRTVLERIAAGYEVDTEREDQSAEQRD